MVSKQGSTQTTYGYAYDEFSRLKEGIHTNSLNEKLITYDANGNITALTRQGGTNPGTFTYTYDGNKLSQLKIGSTAYNYAYDANGNTTTDGMRGFTLAYNLLNLPKSVSKGTDKLEYVYDAVGNKLAKKKNNSFTQYYSGSIVYKADKTPEYVMHGEGLALNVSGTFNYQYNINDHLGNTRLVRNAAKSVEQRNDYYPFGLTHATPSNLQKNKYLYNGKEYQDELIGSTLFGELDYGARFYDPVIARFTTNDPLREKYYPFSPYVYVGNNPIRLTDPTGMIWEDPKEAARLKSSINNQITSLQGSIESNRNAIENGQLTEEEIVNLNNEIQEAEGRISNLRKSSSDIDRLALDENNVYVIAKTSGESHTVRQGEKNKVYIETSSDAITIHEVTHISQSLDAGGLKFSPDGVLRNAGVGERARAMNEVEAYQRQYSFDLSFPGRTNGKGLSGINVFSVGDIRNSNNEIVYEDINSYANKLRTSMKKGFQQ